MNSENNFNPIIVLFSSPLAVMFTTLPAFQSYYSLIFILVYHNLYILLFPYFNPIIVLFSSQAKRSLVADIDISILLQSYFHLKLLLNVLNLLYFNPIIVLFSSRSFNEFFSQCFFISILLQSYFHLISLKSNLRL